MPDLIAKRLRALPKLSRGELCDLWKQLIGPSPHPKLRSDLMIPILAFRLQEQCFGSLSPAHHGRLRQLANALETDSSSTLLSVRGIKPGTRLLRQWGNQVHLVTVEAKGYQYHGTLYQSLSRIAHLITGTHWSGPLFFGIKPDQARKSQEAA